MELNVTNRTYKDLVLQLFIDIEPDDLEYIYRGEITARLVMNVLDLTKSNLSKAEDASRLKSKIYYIMGEGLQNITRHQELSQQDSPEKSAIIVVRKKELTFSVSTGNLIRNENVKPLKSKLEKINNMNINELKDFSRYVRMTTEISEKGGASLGLIEMAKRSGNKLSYDFKDLDLEFSYFYLNTEIPINKNLGEELLEQEEGFLDKLKEFHQVMNRENFILSFKGDLNQENMIYLLNMVKSQMSETTTSIKLNNVLVELLQNIVKHADNKDCVSDWKPGIFLINESETEYFLTAGNYINDEKVEPLKAKITSINELTEQGLTTIYRKNLFDFENPNPVKTGLGFIDMRRKSGKKLDFSFQPIENGYSFFTVQVKIDKK